MMLLALVPAFVACDDDDDNYYYVDNGGTWTTYGNLEKIDNGSRQNYAIRIDDGDRLIVSDGLRFSADAEDEASKEEAEGEEPSALKEDGQGMEKEE